MRTSRRSVSALCAAVFVFASVAVTGTSAQAHARPNKVVTPKSVSPSGWRYGYLSVRSDVLNASLSMESYYSTNNAYPTTKKQATAKSNADRLVPTRHVSLTISTDGSSGYCVLGWNMMTMYKAATPKVYDTQMGGLQPDSTPGHVVRCSIKYPYTFTLP